MRNALGLSLAIALTLTSCRGPVTSAPVGAQKRPTIGTTDAPAIALTSTSPKASLAPVAVTASTPASPRPSQAPAAPALRLLSASAGTVALSGVVAVDPSYIVEVGAGKLLGSVAAPLLAAGLISDQGGGILSNNGSGILSNNGGSILSNNGGGIISNNGSSALDTSRDLMLGGDGSAIVGPGDGNAIAPIEVTSLASAGSGLTTSAHNRRILSTEQAPSLVMAAGMAVYVRSLSTGKPIPLGQGPDGKPAYAAYSNWQGGYKVFVPADIVDTVQVVAVVPGQAESKLRYQRLTSASERASVPVDDDTTETNDLIYAAMQRSLASILTGDLEKAKSSLHFGSIPRAVAPTFEQSLAGHVQRAKAAGLDKLTEAQQLALASRMADILFAKTPLDAIYPKRDMVGPENPLKFDNLGVVPVLTDLTRRNRLRLSKRIAALRQAGQNPAEVLSNLPSVLAASKRDGVTYRLERGADYSDFVTKAMYSQPLMNPVDIIAATAAFDAEAQVDPMPGSGQWFLASLTAMQVAFGTTLFTNDQVAAAYADLFKQAAP